MEENEREEKEQIVKELSDDGEHEKQEEKMSKSRPTYGVFLLILLFGIILGFVFAVGMMLLMKDDLTSLDKKAQRESTTKTEKDTKKNQIVELSEKDISNYNAIIEYFNNHYGDQYPLEISSFSNKDILWTSFSIGRAKKEIVFQEPFSKDLMKKMVQYIYGADASYTDEDIPCPIGDGVLYRFDNNQYTFATDVLHGHGGEGSFRSKFYFLKGIRNDDANTMEIQGEVLYGDYCGDTCGPITNFYKSASTKSLDGFYDKDGEYDSEDFDVAYQKFNDQLPITTFTFKKDSAGGYALNKITVE